MINYTKLKLIRCNRDFLEKQIAIALFEGDLNKLEQVEAELERIQKIPSAKMHLFKPADIKS